MSVQLHDGDRVREYQVYIWIRIYTLDGEKMILGQCELPITSSSKNSSYKH